MGHALNGSLQDVLVRWHRMQGYDTLWQPGYDHAGISTQNVVEKELAREGLSRQDIGREAFVERTWDWLEHSGRTIMGQFRRLGCSLDYSRERFTMDDDYVHAVMTFFVRLWDRGWIYRANRIVNWCPFHQTPSRTSRSSTRRWTIRCLRSATPLRTVTAGRASRSRPCARPRFSATSPSRSTRTTSATRGCRPRGRRAVYGTTRPGHRRRSHRPHVRDGCAQGHAWTRSVGLRHRP